MNHNPVFEYSDHFDNEYLQELYGNNIELALAVFEEYYITLTESFENTRDYLLSSDWVKAANAMHYFKKAAWVGRLTHEKELLEMERLLHTIHSQSATSGPPISTDVVDVNTIIDTFNRIQLAELARLPHLLTEMDRMRVYLSNSQRRS